MNGFDGPGDTTTRPGFADAARLLPDHELDRRIQTGWDEWCELADALLNTAGLLPSRELAGRVINFLRPRVLASRGRTYRSTPPPVELTRAANAATPNPQRASMVVYGDGHGEVAGVELGGAEARP